MYCVSCEISKVYEQDFLVSRRQGVNMQIALPFPVLPCPASAYPALPFPALP